MSLCCDFSDSAGMNSFCRFSSDPETSMGLVQHEGGPCGVLAAIQVIILLLNLTSYSLMVITFTNIISMHS